MAHAWPPNDPEREDWDRRDAAHRHHIAELEADLMATKADLLVAREALETQITKANSAKAALSAASERAAELRRVVEFYAGSWASVRRDKGQKAREAL